METVNFIAGLWGFSLVLIPLSLLLNQRVIKKILAAIEDEAMMYFCGVGCAVLGIASLLSYNAWQNDWKTVVTVLGWLLLARGAMQLFFPKTVVNLIEKFKDSEWIPYGLVAAVILGCVFVYLAFTT